MVGVLQALSIPCREIRLAGKAPSIYEVLHGCRSGTNRVIGMHRKFGVWLIVSKQSFEDPRIWREDSQSYALQTRFQRCVGVKYVGERYPRFPNALTGFGSIVPRNRPRSMALLFKDHFHAGPVRPQSFWLRTGYRAVLARATGYAIISTRRLRRVSSPGVVFVGSMWIRDSNI
jgi:hypothetical protein